MTTRTAMSDMKRLWVLAQADLHWQRTRTPPGRLRRSYAQALDAAAAAPVSEAAKAGKASRVGDMKRLWVRRESEKARAR